LHGESNEQVCARLELFVHEVEGQTGQRVDCTDGVVGIWLEVRLTQYDAEERIHGYYDKDDEILRQASFTSKKIQCRLPEALVKAVFSIRRLCLSIS